MKNKNLSGGLFVGKPSPLAIRETPLSKQIAEWLANRGVWNERLNSGKIETRDGRRIHLCERGTPDRIAVVRGRAIFVEVKTFGEKCSPEQLEKHDELRQSGSIVIVVDLFTSFREAFEAIRSEIERRPARGELCE